MKRKIIFSIAIFCLLSCESEENKNLKSKLEILQKKNDSLRTIVDTLNTKFIFDHASLQTIPLLWKQNKPDEFTALICYVAWNNNEKIVVSTEYNSELDLVNPDTLTGDELILTMKRKEVDTIHYKTITKPKYGKEFESLVSDPMKNYH